MDGRDSARSGTIQVLRVVHAGANKERSPKIHQNGSFDQERSEKEQGEADHTCLSAESRVPAGRQDHRALREHRLLYSIHAFPEIPAHEEVD